MNNRQLGRLGEDAAAQFLGGKGYRILCRNFTCRAGEIDIVASKGAVLHFIEVKTRQGDLFGTPAESIDQRKKGHIRMAAKIYLSTRPKGFWQPRQFQFDAVEIQINHIEDIF
ncbi:YraN family protein [Anaerovorax odorimutans]|uniref:UPF0102 protein NE619_01130 n=1 Tax=Anaerovorax odorimutans TaxID=109327 RepID=A0ABT1RJG3_9FIRM|nr:YraN family protein [Anaerovorax odorimutans]MCQ4635318.1 YraN family protein [Anaerovorax odorimutans]